jgi:hypothetical protein
VKFIEFSPKHYDKFHHIFPLIFPWKFQPPQIKSFSEMGSFLLCVIPTFSKYKNFGKVEFILWHNKLLFLPVYLFNFTKTHHLTQLKTPGKLPEL